MFIKKNNAGLWISGTLYLVSRTKPKEKMYTAEQAAGILQCSPQYLRRLIKDGKVKAEKFGTAWMIHPSEIEKKDLTVFNQPKKVVDRKSTRQHSEKKLNAISFFSGAMGLDLGLEKAGINILLACEFDEASRKTITTNDNEVGLIGDILAYSTKDILKFSNIKSKKQIDLIVGGPPCQAFSTAGKRMGFSDERGNVFLKYIEIIEDIKPKYVVIENVRGLLSSKLSIETPDAISLGITDEMREIPGSSLYYIKKRLENAGYLVTFNLYNSANYGVPQIRERVVIICTKLKDPVGYITPTHSNVECFKLKPWVNFREAVSDLKEIGNHIEFSEKRAKYIAMLKPGEYWKHLPQRVQKEAMGNSYNLGGGKTGFYRRLAWEKPSPTLVTHPAMPATELAHPTELRPLSINEYKCIQQFPIDWKICGNLIEQYKQIGNAVPVGLGFAIGKMIINHYKNKKEKTIPNFPYSRYKFTSNAEFETNYLKQVKMLNKTKENQLKLNF